VERAAQEGRGEEDAVGHAPVLWRVCGVMVGRAGGNRTRRGHLILCAMGMKGLCVCVHHVWHGMRVN
jgi:hypothetical protein